MSWPCRRGAQVCCDFTARTRISESFSFVLPVAESAWGKIRRQEDYLDTQKVAGLDATLADLSRSASESSERAANDSP